MTDVPFAGEDKSKDKKAGIVCSNAQYSCRVCLLSFFLFLDDLTLLFCIAEADHVLNNFDKMRVPTKHF